MTYEQKQRLIKKKQELVSWQGFYLNLTDSLMVSRYPKGSKLVLDKNTGEYKKVSTIPWLWASKRFEEDRQAGFKLGIEVRKIQDILDIENKRKQELNKTSK